MRYISISKQIFFIMMLATLISMLVFSSIATYFFELYLPTDAVKMMDELKFKLNTLLIAMLCFSAIISFALSKTITKPLKEIGKKISQTAELSSNKPIEWKGFPDLIPIVESYNIMIERIEQSAKELAKNEREKAWKDLAKIAMHEIKNPLTPIRLTLEHFSATFDPKDANAKQKAQDMVNSIIEQIDLLKKLANSFSYMAENDALEKNTEFCQTFDVLQNIKNIFKTLNIKTYGDNIKIPISPDNFKQVLNNLFVNSFEAEATDIFIELKEDKLYKTIKITDNGKGVCDCEKIFQPKFSTKNCNSGLGLFISKSIIEKAGGKIICLPIEKGACFEIVFS